MLLDQAIELARKQEINPGYPRITGLGDDDVPIFGASLQGAKGIADMDMDARVFMDIVVVSLEKWQGVNNRRRNFRNIYGLDIMIECKLARGHACAQTDYQDIIPSFAKEDRNMGRELEGVNITEGIGIGFAINDNGA